MVISSNAGLLLPTTLCPYHSFCDLKGQIDPRAREAVLCCRIGYQGCELFFWRSKKLQNVMIISEHDRCRSKQILKQGTKSAPRQLILHTDKVFLIAITKSYSGITVSDKSTIVVVRVMSRPERKTKPSSTPRRQRERERDLERNHGACRYSRESASTSSPDLAPFQCSLGHIRVN